MLSFLQVIAHQRMDKMALHDLKSDLTFFWETSDLWCGILFKDSEGNAKAFFFFKKMIIKYSVY